MPALCAWLFVRRWRCRPQANVPSGWLRVTADFRRAYYLRPEVHPVEESCDGERRLHASLMDDPERPVSPADLERSAGG